MGSSRFGRNVAILTGGTALGQATIILATPVLTRLFMPSEFGFFGAFTSAVLVLIAVSTLRYNQAIPVASDEVVGRNLVLISFGLVGITALLTGLAVWLASHTTGFLGPHSGLIILLFSVSLLAGGVAETLTFYCIRLRRYTPVAEARILQNASQAGSQVLLGFLGFLSIGLLLGDSLGRTLSSLRLLRYTHVLQMFASISGTEIRRALSVHAKFPKLMAPATLLNALAVQSPLLILPLFFSLTQSGSYFLAYRVLVLPTSLIGAAIGQVFFGEAASLKELPKLQQLSGKLVTGLVAVYAPLYLLVAIGGESLFSLVFGPEWHVAGVYAQFLAPMALIGAIASPLASLLVVSDRLRESLVFTGLELASKLLALGIGAIYGSVLLGVTLLGCFGLMLNLLALRRFLMTVNVTLRQITSGMHRIVLANLGLLLVATVSYLLCPPTIALAATSAFMGLSYFLCFKRIRELWQA